MEYLPDTLKTFSQGSVPQNFDLGSMNKNIVICVSYVDISKITFPLSFGFYSLK